MVFFQARIAFLQGERKGQENLKNDLVRRIKMLEYALKQERGKFHKLKYGTELQQGDMKPPIIDETCDTQMDIDQSYVAVSNSTWKQGRQLLRQYLQEIGYTDRIIDVRSTRVRALLGLNNNSEPEENHNGSSVNGNESNKRASETQGNDTIYVFALSCCWWYKLLFTFAFVKGGEHQPRNLNLVRLLRL